MNLKQSIGKMVRTTIYLLKIAWREDSFLLSGYFLSSLMGAVFMFGIFILYRELVDRVSLIGSDPSSFFNNPAAPLFLVISTYLFFEYMSRFVFYIVNQYFFEFILRSRFQNILTRKLMTKLGALDFFHLEDGNTRNLIAKVENNYLWKLPQFLQNLNSVIYSVSSIVLSLFIALSFDIKFFILLGVLSLPVYYLRIKYGHSHWTIYGANAPSANKLWYLRSLFTNFNTLAELKLYRLREFFLNRTKTIQDKVMKDFTKPILSYSVSSSLASLFPILAIFLALYYFVSTLPSTQYSIGQFTLLLNLLFTFSTQLSVLLNLFGAFYEDSLFAEDYKKLMSIKNTVFDSPQALTLSPTKIRTIEFKNVTFTYPGRITPVLENINLTIEKGKHAAIVGENGAGKTTLIKLLFRFYDPQRGAIFIDGTNLRQIALDSWYNHLGVLFQDLAKYYLTLEENVSLGNIYAPASYKKQGVLQSLEKAQAKSLISELPKGKNQVLGRWFDEGVELSVGQWQKVAIARALYRNAPLLVLDEPTSNIDPRSEYRIFNNLLKTYRNKSIIFISHRFSTVRNADKIYVLHNSTIYEEGSHIELLKKDGLYASFFSLQKKGYK